MMRSVILFIFVSTLGMLQGQQIKLISEVERRAGFTEYFARIYAISTNDTSYTLDSACISHVYIDSCQNSMFIRSGDLPQSWGFLQHTLIDSATTVTYAGTQYTKRYSYINQAIRPGIQKELVIPDSSQQPLEVLEYRIQGPCGYRIYLESSQENSKNAFFDTTGRKINYEVENRGWYIGGCPVSFRYVADQPNISLKYNFVGMGAADSILWDFGDGNTNSTTLRPSHTYTQPGIYNVCLSIIDALGCSTSTCQTIAVAQDTPICLIDSTSLRVTQQRSRGSRAFTVTTISATVKADSIRYDMGDGSNPYLGIWTSTVFGHQYPDVDTYRVRAIAYANRYGGLQQCADTAYMTVKVPEPEVRMCVQLGPGTSQDTLFFSIANLTNDSLAIRAVACGAFMDHNCLDVANYTVPLLSTFGSAMPFNPIYLNRDTLSFQTPSGDTYKRHVELSHARNLRDPSKRDLWLPPVADSFTVVGKFVLSGTCRESFYATLPEEDFINNNFAFIGLSKSDGTPDGSYQSLLELGCPSAVNIDPVLKSNNALTVWPNPTEGLALATLTGTVPTRYKIRIRDVLGKEVLSYTRPMQEGMAIRLRLGNLSAGLYYIEVQDEAQTLPVLSKPIMVKK